MMFWMTLMLRNRARFWNVRPMPSSAIRWRGTSVSERPWQAMLAALERIEARQAVEQGGLAGSVGTDHAGDLARHDFEGNVFQRDDAAEADRQPGNA